LERTACPTIAERGRSTVPAYCLNTTTTTALAASGVCATIPASESYRICGPTVAACAIRTVCSEDALHGGTFCNLLLARAHRIPQRRLATDQVPERLTRARRLCEVPAGARAAGLARNLAHVRRCDGNSLPRCFVRVLSELDVVDAVRGGQ
jgi:hypothetical protein